MLGFAVSTAVAQDPVTTIATLLTDTEPEPDPEPEPVPDPKPVPEPKPKPLPPPPAPSPPPPSSQPTAPAPPPASEQSTQAKPAKKRKAKKKEEKEEEAVAPFWHEPRDPTVLAFAEPPFTSGPTSASVSPAPLSSPARTSIVGLLLLLAAGLGILMLALAAMPQWAVRPMRASFLLEQWRVQIAATGLSAIFTALISFLLVASSF